MLDDLRNTAATSIPDEELTPPEEETTGGRRRGRGPFLGMTPAQRLLVVFMLLFLTCVLGAFCLLLTGKVVPF
jgi:hypothetical protein